ncbi:DNA-binding response regulator [Weizmannia acidilactici]|uniref:DNA-binding response regulator n=1 Tax=Weizmannia acidilactici TaxID=2607726 RepID=A0A5J4JCP6_9BACI|nr:response regulator transcription factor [Weizmannia acidilactici]GER69763.1 DNA-binding response regulator [Weizmannia acidilactici]GER73202.1 DNA-binding response regulator [Weizmannia acidilactici]
MPESQILLVENEESVASFIYTELSFEGYTVEVAYDGEEALRKFSADENNWDLILLDWMLPKLDGLEVCRRIRKKSHVPIIILTARDQIGDKVAGLDGGADDYMTKPFEIEELLARVRVGLRHKKNLEKQSDRMVFHFEDLTVNLEKRSVERAGKIFYLTQREFDLLTVLIKHQRKVMTREQLLSEVWGYDFMGQTNIVDVYIRYLRNKIDRGQEHPLIQTVRGVGYSLDLMKAEDE